MDISRIFDALNDIAQLEAGIKAVRKAGGFVEGTVCYSGDSEPALVVISLSGLRFQCHKQSLGHSLFELY